MKKTLLIFSLLASVTVTNAQGFKNILKKAMSDTSSKGLGGILGSMKTTALSNTDIVTGLKEALEVGTEKGTQKLSSVNGFFSNAALKILMPAEAKNVEQKLRTLGLGKQVDNAILTMNRAAEDAAKGAAPIFITAIKQMSIQDATSILKGGDFAATDYLKSKTTAQLSSAFKPVVEASLSKVNATKYWNTIFSTYNQFSSQKVNPDLTAYVTEKALAGIFTQIGSEEQQIRKNPAARTTEILKKVFSSTK